MKTDDTEKRKEIACSLADSLQPRAIQLLLGFQEPIQSPVQSIRAATALKEMFIRYQNIVNQQNNIARAYECISFIPSNEAVRYLGVQSVGNQEPKSALNLVKTMPYEEKETALLSGLLAPNGNEAMVDAVIAELKLTYGLNAQSKIFDLWLQHYEIKNFKRALDSYGNLSQFDDNAMIKVIDKWSQNKDSNQLLSVISAFGDRAVSYLINRIEDTNYQDLLARLGESSLAELQTLMNSSDEQTWTAAANTIVQMGKYHPETTDFLYRAVDDSNLRIVAENYRFYIRAGIEGSEDVLIRALDRYFSRPMCKDYINCRYDYLENLARDIANRHGYQVYSTHGTHSGPRWGEGN